METALILAQLVLGSGECNKGVAKAPEAPVIVASLECNVNCSAADKSGCWAPGAMYKLNHGCK